MRQQFAVFRENDNGSIVVMLQPTPAKPYVTKEEAEEYVKIRGRANPSEKLFIKKVKAIEVDEYRHLGTL